MKQKIDKCRRQEHLDMYQQSINDDDFQYLCSKPWCNNIKSLKLNANNISWVGISSFCKADWSNLTKLQLTNNKISDKGCKYLSRANIRLIQASLNACQIGSPGILHLAKSKWNLKILSLTINKSIGQDFRALSKMRNKMLQKIGINCGPFGNILYVLLFEGKLSGFWLIGHYHDVYKPDQIQKDKFKEILEKRYQVDHLSLG